MAQGINKVIIVGNLGQDPESRSFPDGGSVCNISVATSESWKDKQTGQQKESTEWHRIVFKNRLAEIAQQYLRKGSKVYIEGKLKTRKWTNQQGQDQYTTEVMASQMQMLDGKNDSQSDTPQPTQQHTYQNAPQAQPYTARQDGESRLADGSIQTIQAPQGNPAAGSFDDFTDDIPF